MSKVNATYPTRRLLVWVIVFEAIFDALFLAWLFGMGFFDSVDGTHDFLFQQPRFLAGIPLLFLSYLGFIWLLHWKNTRLKLVANSSILRHLFQRESDAKLLLLMVTFRNTLFFLLIALSQPIYGTQTVRTAKMQGESVLVLDISNSMNVRDLDSVQSRLDIAKRTLQQYINETPAQRVGVVVFAGTAYVQLALTSDFEAAKMFIAEIQTDLLSQQGTNIRSALETAQNMFTKGGSNRTILLVTDGENHDGDLPEALEALQQEKIKLGIVGIGTETGGLIPADLQKPYLGYRVDDRGEHIVSKLNPTLIRALATKSNGTAVLAENAFPDIEPITRAFEAQRRDETEKGSIQIKRSYYSLFAFIALLHFMAYVIIRSTPDHLFRWKRGE